MQSAISPHLASSIDSVYGCPQFVQAPPPPPGGGGGGLSIGSIILIWYDLDSIRFDSIRFVGTHRIPYVCVSVA